MKYVAAAAVVLAARVVFAEPECSTSAVRARAAELLGQAPLETYALEIDADGHTGRVIFDRDRSRTVTAASCSELVEGLALVVAMAVRSLPVPAAPDVPAPSAPVPAPSAPVADDTLGVERIVAAPPRAQVEATSGVGVGWSTKHVDEQLVVGARIHRGSRSIGIAARFMRPYENAVGDAGVQVSAVAFTADPCLWRGSWSVCATATGGWFTGRGERLLQATTDRLLDLELGSRVGWEMRVSPAVALRATLDVEVPLLRDRFLVDQMPVWQSGVHVWLGAAALVQIP